MLGINQFLFIWGSGDLVIRVAKLGCSNNQITKSSNNQFIIMFNLSEKIDRPAIQAIVIFAAALFIMGIGWIFTASGIFHFDRLFAWSIGSALMLFFALMNSLLSLRAASFVKYWGASMYSYLALAIGTSMAAWGFSGIPLADAGSYRWIYIVVTVGFLVFLSMVNLMRIIVKFAEKEEWHHPRKR